MRCGKSKRGSESEHGDQLHYDLDSKSIDTRDCMKTEECLPSKHDVLLVDDEKLGGESSDKSTVNEVVTNASRIPEQLDFTEDSCCNFGSGVRSVRLVGIKSASGYAQINSP